jgi:hypothetical protein
MTQPESDLPPGLSAPAQRARAGAGYVRLEQLTRLSEADPKRLHGIRPKTIRQLRSAPKARGLLFAEEKRRWAQHDSHSSSR